MLGKIGSIISKVLNKEEVQYIKLHKPRGIVYECNIQKKEIEAAGDKILNTINLGDEILIMYLKNSGDRDSSENGFSIGMRVITREGILSPDMGIHAVFYKKTNEMGINGIEIHRSKGFSYGTYMLKQLFKMASMQNIDSVYGRLSVKDFGPLEEIRSVCIDYGFTVAGCKLKDIESKEYAFIWLRGKNVNA